MSALSTRLTLGATAATTSTACFTTAITSSHSPSMLVNIALVSFGRPDARPLELPRRPPHHARVAAGRADAERHDHCLLYPVGRTTRMTRSALSGGGSVSGPLYRSLRWR